jgi:hypothetical protein
MVPDTPRNIEKAVILSDRMAVIGLADSESGTSLNDRTHALVNNLDIAGSPRLAEELERGYKKICRAHDWVAFSLS